MGYVTEYSPHQHNISLITWLSTRIALWRKENNLSELYELVVWLHFKAGKVHFYRDPRDYTCVCCGQLRLMVNGEERCVPGIAIMGQNFHTGGKACKYFGIKLRGHKLVCSCPKRKSCRMIKALDKEGREHT